MFHVGALWGYKIKAHIITRPRSHPSSCFDFSLYWWLIGLFCFCFAALLPQSNSLIVRGPLPQGVLYIWTDHTTVLQQCDPALIISHWSSHELLCRWLCGAEAAAAILLTTADDTVTDDEDISVDLTYTWAVHRTTQLLQCDGAILTPPSALPLLRPCVLVRSPLNFWCTVLLTTGVQVL